jgi:hypothetical protein
MHEPMPEGRAGERLAHQRHAQRLLLCGHVSALPPLLASVLMIENVNVREVFETKQAFRQILADRNAALFSIRRRLVKGL